MSWSIGAPNVVEAPNVDGHDEGRLHDMFMESLNELRNDLRNASSNSSSTSDPFSLFGSNTNMRSEMIRMIDRIEADHEWSRDSDPDLEERIVGVVNEYISTPFEMV